MTKKEKEYIEELESALVDLLTGVYSVYNIRATTKLPIKRCKKIEALYHKVKEKRKG